MSYNLPGDVNPFQAPRAGIGERALEGDLADSDAEVVRRAHLGREANIKSVGSLAYLGMIGGLIATVVLFLIAAGVVPTDPNQMQGVDPATQKLLFAGFGVGALVVTFLYGAVGYGLTHLQNWARWTVVVVISLNLLYSLYTCVILMMINPAFGLVALPISMAIPGFILWLLVSSKAKVVFSPEYKEVIRKTPHIKQKTSIIVKILVGILLFFILIGVLAAIFGGGRR